MEKAIEFVRIKSSQPKSNERNSIAMVIVTDVDQKNKMKKHIKTGSAKRSAFSFQSLFPRGYVKSVCGFYAAKHKIIFF
ncbi:MAG: hypothetical protein PUC05_00410 [Firmicutes bacterium]|nr:hypothetical protein [Bacillota bacterium]